MKRIARFYGILFSWLLPLAAHAQDTTRLSLLFLGDIMQHDSQIEAAYDASTGAYDYTKCFAYLAPYFNEADLTIGNLELTLGGPPFKGYPQFSAPDELVVALKNAGLDVLVTANNHSLDRRRKGLERTIRVLDSLGISHTGTFRDSSDRLINYPLIISKHGIKLALLNYTYGTNGIPVTKPNIVNPIDTALIRMDLQRARELEADVSIVFMHWGDEYQLLPNKTQKTLTEFCFRHGASLVIGAHPHVLQPMEWRKDANQLVAYSLGNFVSGQRPRNRDGGAMIQIELSKIRYSGQSHTRIDTTFYMLQWVYKILSGKREFIVLPVPSVERAPHEFIKDEVSLAAFKTFIDDSRSHLLKQNKHIAERKQAPPDTIIRYRIELPADSEVYLRQHELVYGVEPWTDATGQVHYVTGSFSRREEAERYLATVVSRWPESKLVVFVNGTMHN